MKKYFWVFTIVIVAVLSLIVVSAQDDVSQEEQNKEVVRSSIELLWNTGDISPTDMPNFYTTGTLQWYAFAKPTTVSASASFFEFFGTNIWPDRETTIQHLFAEDDMVVAHLRTTGTFEGHLSGYHNCVAPNVVIQGTGGYAEWDFVIMYRLEDGKIVEEWWFWNREFIEPHLPQE